VYQEIALLASFSPIAAWIVQRCPHAREHSGDGDFILPMSWRRRQSAFEEGSRQNIF
jgi:hypothetical protein